MNFSSLQAKDNASFDVSPSDVVRQQPASGLRLPAEVPAGLELLARLDELHIRVTDNCGKYIPCMVKKKEVDFDDKHGQLAYVIGDKSCRCGWSCNCCNQCPTCECAFDDCCKGKGSGKGGCQCCAKYREDVATVLDNNHEHEVLDLYRELSSHCCDTGYKVLHVDAPRGTYIGQIILKDPCCSTGYFVVEDASGNTILRIKHPGCCDKGSSICSKTELKMNIFPREGSERVGTIKVKSGGCCSKGKIVVKFPLDLDVKAKALLLATPILMGLLGM